MIKVIDKEKNSVYFFETMNSTPNCPDRPHGTLFVVATPIGNLGDISCRAKQTLAKVDLIACEDTRHTRKLLSHLHIHTPLTSYYRERERGKTIKLLAFLHEGKSIALVSDAGTPCLSDPGSLLISAARAHEIRVIPVPGPSALTAAISIAGLTQNPFYFAGFVSAKTKQRKKELKRLAHLPCPLIFYESPHRIHPFLKDCLVTFGKREGMILRELTKIHEEVITGSLSRLVSVSQKGLKGELVVIITGAPGEESDPSEDLASLLSWYKKKSGMSLKDAVYRISQDLNIPRTKVYRKALDIWQKP